MQTGSPMGSAQIIPFPIRARGAAAGSDANRLAAATSIALIYDAGCASSWYHEEAVVDDRRGPKS